MTLTANNEIIKIIAQNSENNTRKFIPVPLRIPYTFYSSKWPDFLSKSDKFNWSLYYSKANELHNIIITMFLLMRTRRV